MNKTKDCIKNQVIFLTGCINPEGMSFTKLQDPKIRKRQYVDAINFYLKTSSLPILFVENSGTDISKTFEEEILRKRLEVITFNGNLYNKSLGKGFGEMLIIEKALKDSAFLKDADFVFKITGRYKLLNLETFVRQYQREKSVELMVDLTQKLNYADSRFWGSTIRFLNEILLRYKNEVNDTANLYFEHALFYASHEAISKKYFFSYFKYKPRFEGVSGTENKKYNHSLIYWIPLNIKQLIKFKLFN